MDKLRRGSGSKSITGYKDKDLSKRDYSQISRIFIFSILLLLFFALTIQPGSSAPDPTYFFEGYDTALSKWQRSNICCYLEGDCVPCRVIVDNTKPGAINDTLAEQIFFDYNSEPDYSGKLGVVDLENFNLPNGTTSGYFAENDTADNSYTVTSNAKVSPVANFTSNSPQIYCYNITFNGTATCGTPPYTYDWDFCDGNTNSTEQNTSHRYSASGTYDVTLTVTDANGCTNSTTRQVVASSYTAGLAITKEANVTSATVGTVIRYTINVSNTGNATLTSVLVTDSLTGLNETIPILAHGATQTFNTTHTVTESELCGPISNTATANGTDPCGVAVGPVSASVGVTPGYTAGLSVVKNANVTSATVGTVIGYTINVSNTGNVNLTSVLVTDSLTGLNETITILAPGSFHIFNTTYTVTGLDISGWIINRATANGTDPCGYLTPTAIGVFGVRSG